ncbi:hypothetical protein [Streptomyces sp. NBC_00572]|nr:hypothetical protein [Streptomyces sp. NBC_00572]MCX4981399.1 hypothetical protein [Streptomyces sp. NBC_00572]
MKWTGFWHWFALTGLLLGPIGCYRSASLAWLEWRDRRPPSDLGSGA